MPLADAQYTFYVMDYQYERIVLCMYHTSWLSHQSTVDMVQIQRSRLIIPTEIRKEITTVI